jgi:hypothetical protein
MISVLSSGALIFSLPAKKLIIAPYVGSFKDLGDMGIVANYHSFNDIANLTNYFELDKTKIDEYLNTYTWDNFILTLKNCLNTQ